MNRLDPKPNIFELPIHSERVLASPIRPIQKGPRKDKEPVTLSKAEIIRREIFDKATRDAS